ncbi:MAG: hypothetical protein V1660_01045 [archaeon]
MEEIPKVKVVYGNEEFELTEQELDRVVAIASKRLRNDLIGARLGFLPVKRNELKNENDIKVIKDGYESELYRAMAETMVYAIENGYLDEYALCGCDEEKSIAFAADMSSKIDRNAINTLARIRNQTSHELIDSEIQKMLFSKGNNCIFY